MLFLAPGLGIGLVFVFTLSTFRLLAPTAGTWIPFVFGSAALFMGVGYLTPTPDDGDSDDDGDDAAVYYAATYPQGDRDGWSMLPVDGS
jgi:hypothetical protein